MSPGVNFDRASADRIEKAVLAVERSPLIHSTAQRRRAGGLGRMSLWEVTAIQTTPKTVTLQRVGDADMVLMDVRDREDIFYDPDAEPSVGDRGLVIRLGDGSLFFFKRGTAVVSRVYADEAAELDVQNPDTAPANYPTGLRLRTDISDNTVEWATVWKFASALPGTFSVGSLQEVLMKFSHLAWGITDNMRFQSGSSTVRVQLQITPIRESFDLSTLTYNQLIALAGFGWADFANVLEIRAATNDFTLRQLAGWGRDAGEGDPCHQGTSLRPWFTNPTDLVYGFACRLFRDSTAAPDNGSVVANGTLGQTSLGTWRTFIEWNL